MPLFLPLLFFNPTTPPDIYTFPYTTLFRSIAPGTPARTVRERILGVDRVLARALEQDRKSTRLNSSHLGISYAVFCLKKKKVYDAQWCKFMKDGVVDIRLRLVSTHAFLDVS